MHFLPQDLQHQLFFAAHELIAVAFDLKQLLSTVVSRQQNCRKIVSHLFCKTCLYCQQVLARQPFKLATPEKSKLIFKGQNLLPCFSPLWHAGLLRD